MKSWLVGCVAACAAMLILGCGGTSSTDQPLDQVQAEASKMSVDDLKAKGEAVKAEIAKCQDQLKALGEQLKKVTNPLGDEAKKIAQQSSDATSTLGKLKERLAIYMDELAKKTAAATTPKTN